MSSLVPERTLLFSPALAATIGLEEAILLHLLHDLSLSRAPEPARGAHWFEVEVAAVERLLPFWERGDLARICRSLSDKGIVQIDSPPLTSAANLRFAFEQRSDEAAPSSRPRAVDPVTPRRSSSSEPPPRRPSYHSAAFGNSSYGSASRGGATLLSPDWQPGEDLMQLLALNHGISRSYALAQVEDFVLYWRERGEVSHAWASRFRQHVLRQWRLDQQRQEQERGAAGGMDGEWTPSEDALQILQRSGVSPAFIEDAIPEFILYWRERGEATTTWNSKFIAHIRRQWARYSNAVAHERDPHPIASDWQPSEDVYDILRMANIELAFARELLPEFILFWRDAGTPQRSWNTKFLQHVKYQWATRQQRPGQQLQAPASAFAQLTDRSWASGLVDGV
jgi:hypothetical protein